MKRLKWKNNSDEYMEVYSLVNILTMYFRIQKNSFDMFMLDIDYYEYGLYPTVKAAKLAAKRYLNKIYNDLKGDK